MLLMNSYALTEEISLIVKKISEEFYNCTFGGIRKAAFWRRLRLVLQNKNNDFINSHS